MGKQIYLKATVKENLKKKAKERWQKLGINEAEYIKSLVIEDLKNQ